MGGIPLNTPSWHVPSHCADRACASDFGRMFFACENYSSGCKFFKWLMEPPPASSCASSAPPPSSNSCPSTPQRQPTQPTSGSAGSTPMQPSMSSAESTPRAAEAGKRKRPSSPVCPSPIAEEEEEKLAASGAPSKIDLKQPKGEALKPDLGTRCRLVGLVGHYLPIPVPDCITR